MNRRSAMTLEVVSTEALSSPPNLRGPRCQLGEREEDKERTNEPSSTVTGIQSHCMHKPKSDFDKEASSHPKVLQQTV